MRSGPMKSGAARRGFSRTLQQVLLVLAVLAVGAVAAGALMLTRAAPRKEDRPVVGPLVELLAVQRQDVPVRVLGHGTVKASVQTRVVPQVSGRVIAQNPNMVTGGFIKADDTLLEIDASDYELALKSARTQAEEADAAIATAEANITVDEVRVRDAQDELARTTTLHEQGVATAREKEKADVAYRVASALLRASQARLAAAKAQLSSAELAAEQAQLNLQRTKITLPFDAVVVSEQVDVGQYVTAGTSIGEVYGTTAVEIPVPLEDEELQWFNTVPMARQAAQAQTAPQSLPIAEVKARFAGKAHQWQGQVVRTDAQVDPRSRMVHVIVEVQQPFPAAAGEKLPLMPGTFVQVSIHGKTLVDVVPLPRYALRPGDEVWVVRNDRLEIRPVDVVRREAGTVYIADGLESGEQVVTSSLDLVTNGMQVRSAPDAQSNDKKEPPPK